MTRTAPLAIAAILSLPAAGAQAAPAHSPARVAALEALAAKADLPAAPPALPSLLTDRDPGRSGPDARGGAGQDAAQQAKDTAKGQARSEAAKAHAAAANGEAAREAAEASDDVRGAAEKKNADRTRKKPKPTHPSHPRGGGND